MGLSKISSKAGEYLPDRRRPLARGLNSVRSIPPENQLPHPPADSPDDPRGRPLNLNPGFEMSVFSLSPVIRRPRLTVLAPVAAALVPSAEFSSQDHDTSGQKSPQNHPNLRRMHTGQLKHHCIIVGPFAQVCLKIDYGLRLFALLSKGQGQIFAAFNALGIIGQRRRVLFGRGPVFAQIEISVTQIVKDVRVRRIHGQRSSVIIRRC